MSKLYGDLDVGALGRISRLPADKMSAQHQKNSLVTHRDEDPGQTTISVINRKPYVTS